MSLSRTNRKIVEELRAGLDKEAVEQALQQVLITPRQAKTLHSWIDAVREIRANPIHAVQGKDGSHIGEVVTRNAGRTWIARRYGKTYPAGEEFHELELAFQYVREAEAGCF
ncbi:hypothetical protein ACSVIJ_12370 [Pseudomonas sp. NCHU5208]|uniref:hypothetical protein n=1 Tax=unclassified Pseudomonas TaxID=196821 RepID=UPI003F9C9F41